LRRQEAKQLTETAMIGRRDSRIDDTLPDERRVFLECVEDVLASTPGLRYALLLDPREIGSRDPAAYALFLVRTNPACRMTLSIELADRAFRVRVNGVCITRWRGVRTQPEVWIERRCRDLHRMIEGDLRLVQHTLLTIPVSSTLEVAREGRRHRIGTTSNRLVGIMSALLPYGFLLNGRRQRMFCEWHR
jgi:hypothetical protein